MGGLSWTAWLLIAAAIVPGLVLALLFYRAHRADLDATERRAPAPDS